MNVCVVKCHILPSDCVKDFLHLDYDADPSCATISSLQMKNLHHRLAGGNVSIGSIPLTYDPLRLDI
jgi:hypothetical protein